MAHSATATLDKPTRPRRALPALCLTQITSWGIVSYAFPVLNPQITDATGWSAAMTTAAFSAALLVSALAGIRVGREPRGTAADSAHPGPGAPDFMRLTAVHRDRPCRWPAR